MLSCSIPTAPGGLPRRQSHRLGKHAGIFQNDFCPCLPYTLFQCLFTRFPVSPGSSAACNSPPPPIVPLGTEVRGVGSPAHHKSPGLARSAVPALPNPPLDRWPSHGTSPAPGPCSDPMPRPPSSPAGVWIYNLRTKWGRGSITSLCPTNLSNTPDLSGWEGLASSAAPLPGVQAATPTATGLGGQWDRGTRCDSDRSPMPR